jgi:hypothetical protein
LIAFFGICWICGGGKDLWDAVGNRSRLETSCDTYLAQRPTAAWVRLSGCDLNYDEAEWIFAVPSKKPYRALKAVYIPVHGSTTPGGPTVLVMKIGDTEVRRLQDFLVADGGDGLKPDQSLAETAKSVMIAHGMPLRQAGISLIGMVDTVTSSEDRNAVAPLAEARRVNSGWGLLKADRNPSWLKGLVELLGGLSCVVTALNKSVRG